MAALDAAVRAQPNPDQNVAAKALDQSEALAWLASAGDLGPNLARRHAVQDLGDQSEALLDFANSDPDSCVDIPLLENGRLEFEPVIGRVGEIAARVEGSPGRAPD